MAGLNEEFAKRNCKVIGLSVDSVGDHTEWSKDIEETQGHAVTYPMIGDTDLSVAKLFDMLHPQRGRRGQRANGGRQCHGALGVRHRAGQEDQTDAHLPHDHGPQL